MLLINYIHKQQLSSTYQKRFRLWTLDFGLLRILGLFKVKHYEYMVYCMKWEKWNPFKPCDYINSVRQFWYRNKTSEFFLTNREHKIVKKFLAVGPSLRNIFPWSFAYTSARHLQKMFALQELANYSVMQKLLKLLSSIVNIFWGWRPFGSAKRQGTIFLNDSLIA